LSAEEARRAQAAALAGWPDPKRPAYRRDGGRTPCLLSIRAGEATAGSARTDVERLGEREVRRVGSAEVVAQLPDAADERSRRVAVERQLVQVGERLDRPSVVEASAEHVRAHDVRHLRVEQVRCRRRAVLPRPPRRLAPVVSAARAQG
jgi:hypothetical protein